MGAAFVLGSTQRINLGSNQNVWRQQGVATLMAWFTPQAVPVSLSYIVGYSTGTSSTGSRLVLRYTGTLDFQAASRNADAGPIYQLSGGVVTLGQTYHVAAVCSWTGQVFELYVDGVLVSSSNPGTWGAAQSNTDSQQASIASNPDGSGDYMTGKVAEVRAYRRRLSAAEIQTIYALRGKDTNRYDLYHRYTLDGGADGTVISGNLADSGIGDRGGTPTNSPVWSAEGLSNRALLFST